MKLQQLISELDPVNVNGSTNLEITGVVSDSRQVRQGSLFVAVKGLTNDGIDFADDAIRKGAVAVIVAAASGIKSFDSGICSVAVHEPRLALAKAASMFCGKPSEKLDVIGITGTNGKTTTAYLAKKILETDGRKTGLITTVEYLVAGRQIPATRTTPDSPELQGLLAQMVDAKCQSAVMEVSSHSILQNRINEVAFDVAVFTNLTRDHLDYHGTMEEYFEAKSLLFSEAPNATAVVNTDDPYGRRLTEEGRLPGKLVTYGTEASAEVRAENITLSESGSSFTVKTPWGTGDVQTRLRGRFNVSNMLAAIAACGDLGVEMECVSRALSEITHIPGRLEEIRSASGFSVFVDYAHTDDALLNVLSTLKEITKGRLIVVFGCGGDRDRTKRPAMGAVASDLADYSILTSDNPRNEDPSSIIAEIEQGFKATDRFEVVEDRREAIERAVAMAESGDTVLVAGKGHETFQEFDKTTVPFDDRQIVKEILGEPSMGSN